MTECTLIGLDSSAAVITEAALVADNAPTMRMRELGQLLEQLRTSRDISQEKAASWIGVTRTTLSKIERGVNRARLSYVKNLCTLYRVSDDEQQFLEQLAKDSGQRGWWLDFGDAVPDWFGRYLGEETVAAEERIFGTMYVPGVLQCQAYINEVADEDAAQLRAIRQKRLRDGQLHLRVVLDESVLRRVVGNHQVMREQIAHLITLAQLPNVVIQVLPFTANAVRKGTIAAVTGFTALRFADSAIVGSIYIELVNNAIYLERDRDIATYIEIFGRLSGIALDEEGTLAFLETVRREVYPCGS